MQRNWFTVFNIKVTARAYIIKNMTISAVPYKLLVGLQPNCLIVQNHKLECPVEKWD